ncbi:MAG TPA: DUF4838 domain-containing protein, partial [Candidatus Acidoferrales bacterium]|nr:DUF4838 domain-containing protein [Candidatus Acidoferrales bacterium]
SGYAIVIGTEASPSERHAAEEMQSFLEQISGARLPISTEAHPRMVLVGDSAPLRALKVVIPYRELGPEGFVLKTAGPHLVIAGGKLRGSMYGVYTFLEKLGCRWFAPGVSRIPHTPTITLPPIDEMQKPAFEYREPYFSEAADRDWAARNKVNGVLMKLDASTGGRVQYYPFVHSFNTLVPPEKYFRDHPEYFSLIDGKRRAERSQLCLTNPDVLRVGVESVERWITEHPEATILSVSQNDWSGWCECDNCRRVEQEEGGSHSGPLLRYVNALAAEIEKKHPDKLIDTLAYQYTEDPPAKARPRPNVRIRLCPIGVCEAHPYGQCPYSAYFMKNLNAWSKITDRLYIWHYNTNFAHYLLPFPDFDELAADIPMYKEHGVVGLFMEGAVTAGGGAENAELRSYVMAKLLWDPRTDFKRAVDEFHQAFYGRAAPAMLEYFELMQRQVRRPPGGQGSHLWIYDSPGAPYLNTDFIDKAAELLGHAEALAENDTVRVRVRKARLGIDYVRLTRAKRFHVDGEWYRPDDLNGLKERWSTFVARLGQFGITNLSESSLLARDTRDFDGYVRPYAAVTLENEHLRVHVVPDLAGRVVQIFDKHTGKELLFQPDPSAKQYPNLGGLTVAPFSDYLARAPWATRWALAPGGTATETALDGSCENGLKVRRRLWLEGSTLRTRTVLENAGSEPIDALLESRWEVDPGPLDAASLSYRTQAGVPTETRFIQPGRQPSGNETYAGTEQPDGEWSIVMRGGGPVTVSRFAKDQVARCFLNWTAKGENRVGLTVASERRTLKRGESLMLDADYGVR